MTILIYKLLLIEPNFWDGEQPDFSFVFILQIDGYVAFYKHKRTFHTKVMFIVLDHIFHDIPIRFTTLLINTDLDNMMVAQFWG